MGEADESKVLSLYALSRMNDYDIDQERRKEAKRVLGLFALVSVQWAATCYACVRDGEVDTLCRGFSNALLVSASVVKHAGQNGRRW